MRRIRAAFLKVSVATAVVASTVMAIGHPAWASDQGNWRDDGCSSFFASGCFWRGEPGTFPELSSSIRDSDFSNDLYLTNQGLNDGVKVWKNNFSTLHLQAFLDSNYRRPSFCLAGGQLAGPYPIQQRDGLSSFKSC